MRRSILALLGSLCFACGPSETPSVPTSDPIDPPRSTASADQGQGAADPGKPPPTGYGRLDRATFNRMAQRLNLPVYWASDANKNGVVDPDEVGSLLFYPTTMTVKAGNAFTPEFATAYEKLVVASQAAPPSGADAARQTKLLGELDQAASVLVRTNMAGASPEDVKFVRHMHEASRLLDELYALQSGVAKIASKVAPDPASQSVFRRNWGPSCRTPKFEKDKECTAAAGLGEAAVDVWPEGLQKDNDFCKKLEDDKANKAILTPFTAVREEGGKLVAVGYEKAYAPQMKKIAAELRAAAKDITSPEEKALVTYLGAAATAFETNKWEPADEAWAKMNARNSRWYLRIAPDETYWEPCSQKAGFHMSFARIDKKSLELQDKLTPVQQQMEDDLAKLIGAPYKSRKVTFHLPDFIEIVLNAGDSRDPIGATIGQSLPNWGPVANQGRGRTVVMTNLYTDPDSLVVRRAKAASLLSEAAMKRYVDDGGPGLMGTVLHEATHNLGPAHEYRYQGKKDDEAFGGDLASMLEELKAQSGAYYYLYLLADKGIIDQTAVERSITDSLVWGLNHISRGMKTPSGKRKAYSQLAAVQIGFLMDEGAFIWDPKAKSASGATGSPADMGAFSVDYAKMRAASVKMMKVVATIKATNDKKGAIELADRYVEKATSKVPHEIIAERMLRFPQPNFVYAIDW